jgi:hypothetical protein
MRHSHPQLGQMIFSAFGGTLTRSKQLRHLTSPHRLLGFPSFFFSVFFAIATSSMIDQAKVDHSTPIILNGPEKVNGDILSYQESPVVELNLLQTLQHGRDAHAPTHAQSGEAISQPSLSHLIKQRECDPSAAGAHRMSKSDSSTVNVDLIPIKP